MIKKYFIEFFVLIFIIQGFIVGQEKLTDDIEKKVDEYFAPLLLEDLISGSILIAKGGQILLSKGYGIANREYDIKCTTDTKYRLASVSKQFTSMAIMMLEEKGLLSTKDTLSKFIHDYPNGNKITIHHLLTHTSGVVNYSSLPDHYETWSKPHTIQQVIERFKNMPLNFEPGEKFEYSNSGYVLLAFIIEKVSGKTYEEFLTENIFKPLGMNDTGIDSHTKIIRDRAVGHYNAGDGITQADYLYVQYTNGAGSIYSTVNDMFKWDRALYTDKLISPKSIEKMFAQFIANYAYGWFVRDAFGRKLIEHRGGINGFLTMIQRFVDDDVVVISLFNYVSPFVNEINRSLAAIALGESYNPILIPYEVELHEDFLKQYTGKYKLDEDFEITISFDKGKLFYTDPDINLAELIAQNNSKFFLRQTVALVHFLKDKEGNVNRIVIQQNENQFPCMKIE
ncbi:MAG: serine hydrolase [Bacteroidetes bacterium]|nr:serine hydrolase [Bacteroidota bacterium]MBU1114595.1 serine hydrolase [Bacteroidota bacterium]MBU1799633.1 serine hydrolase [Bacteroidota bacterium]